MNKTEQTEGTEDKAAASTQHALVRTARQLIGWQKGLVLYLFSVGLLPL